MSVVFFIGTIVGGLILGLGCGPVSFKRLTVVLCGAVLWVVCAYYQGRATERERAVHAPSVSKANEKQ